LTHEIVEKTTQLFISGFTGHEMIEARHLI
jgi:hypothetical protein